MNGKAVIFDVDGLMLDTERLAKPAWTKALADFGYAISDEFYLQLVGRSVKDVSRMLKEELGEDLQLDEILEHRYQIGFDQIDRGEIKVKFGLYDVLDFLDMNSIPKAVASSSSRLWTDKKFAATGLDRRFDVIVCGDEVDLRGSFSIGKIPGGTYYVQASNSEGFGEVYYPDAKTRNGARSVAIVPGHDAAFIQLALEPQSGAP